MKITRPTILEIKRDKFYAKVYVKISNKLNIYGLRTILYDFNRSSIIKCSIIQSNVLKVMFNITDPNQEVLVFTTHFGVFKFLWSLSWLIIQSRHYSEYAVSWLRARVHSQDRTMLKQYEPNEKQKSDRNGRLVEFKE